MIEVSFSFYMTAKMACTYYIPIAICLMMTFSIKDNDFVTMWWHGVAYKKGKTFSVSSIAGVTFKSGAMLQNNTRT